MTTTTHTAHDEPTSLPSGAGAEADVLVVGGGAAGLSAAVTLGRARRRVVVVDAGAPRNAPADGVHGFLTRDGTPPGELLAIGRAEAAGYGVDHRTGRVTAVTRDGDRFHAMLDDGSSVTARRVVVTTGLADELPPVDGLGARWGRDVIHCPYCHGWEVRDRRVGVLATSAVAVHQAGLFTTLTDEVVLLGHTAPPPDDEAQRTIRGLGIEVVAGEVVAVEVDGAADVLTGVRLADGTSVPLDALVVAPRFVAHADLLARLGIEPDEHASGLGVHVPTTDPTGRTDVPGVWVAGNVADPMATVVAAAAQGNLAGAAVNADLVAADAAAALAVAS